MLKWKKFIFIFKRRKQSIINKIDVTFKRKGIINTKDIYIIMNTEMIKNFEND